jgi:tetratricopeptide (TPR) repeat protein
MKSVVFDESDADHCSIPQLVKQIASDDLSTDVPKKQILLPAAYTQLTPTGTQRTVHFMDFCNAIISFVLAEAYKQAAAFFVMSVPKLVTIASFQMLEMLFLVLNGEPVQGKIDDDYLCWQLVSAELVFRVRDKSSAASDPKVAKLFARMKALEYKQPRQWLPRVFTLSLMVMTRLRRVNFGLQEPSARQIRKIVAPMHVLTRLALKNSAWEQIEHSVQFHRLLFGRWMRVGDAELFKDSLLRLYLAQRCPLPDNVIAEIYVNFALNVSDLDRARAMLVEHAAFYDASNFVGGYFAARYALAILKHERDGEFASARAILQAFEDSQTHSIALRSRVHVSIADTYFAERNYAESTKAYLTALNGHQVQRIRQHVQERLIDSLSYEGEKPKAIRLALSFLRRRRSTLSISTKGHLYARLAYLYAESGQPIKAAITCLGLQRLAEKSDSDQLAYLSLIVAAWIVKSIDFKDDPLIPLPGAGIRDISALSEPVDEPGLKKWLDGDKLKVKAYFQISAVFELKGSYKRAEVLLRRISARAESSDTKPALLNLVCSRLMRLELLLGRHFEAALLFHEVISNEIGGERKLSPERAGLLVCHFLDPVVSHVPDATFQSFVDKAFKECGAWPAAQASILLWQARGLYDRLLVQRAKLVHREAEVLAKNSLAFVVLKSLYDERLFARVPHYHLGMKSWSEDLVAAIAELAKEGVPETIRNGFADNVKMWCGQNASKMERMQSAFDEYKKFWDKYPFEIAALAAWRAGRGYGLTDATLEPLRSIIEKKAPFLEFV